MEMILLLHVTDEANKLVLSEKLSASTTVWNGLRKAATFSYVNWGVKLVE
jgi:hypothetical protein